MDLYGNDPSAGMRQGAPSTPMTGSGVQRRQLSPESMAMQPGGMEEMPPYIPPAFPELLTQEANPQESIGQMLTRRRLPSFGPRRL